MLKTMTTTSTGLVCHRYSLKKKMYSIDTEVRVMSNKAFVHITFLKRSSHIQNHSALDYPLQRQLTCSIVKARKNKLK